MLSLYRYDIVWLVIQALNKLGMTIVTIVIPSFILNHHSRLKNSVWQSKRLSYRLLNPVWHKLTLSYPLHHFIFIVYTHCCIHTLELHSVFQVFSSKTCWLLSTSFNRLLVTHNVTFFSRYSAEFLSKNRTYNSILRTVLHDFGVELWLFVTTLAVDNLSGLIRGAFAWISNLCSWFGVSNL